MSNLLKLELEKSIERRDEYILKLEIALTNIRFRDASKSGAEKMISIAKDALAA